MPLGCFTLTMVVLIDREGFLGGGVKTFTIDFGNSITNLVM